MRCCYEVQKNESYERKSIRQLCSENASLRVYLGK